MKFVKIRPCDAACCRAAPAFPEQVGDKECKYRDPSTPEKGCRIMRGEIALFGDDKEKFEIVCERWPQNMPNRDTGNCCWQWVE